MLGVGLGEHHQFGVARVTAEAGVTGRQVIDLVAGQGEAETLVGCRQSRLGVAAERNTFEWQRSAGIEQVIQLGARGQHRFGHRVMQDCQHLPPRA